MRKLLLLTCVSALGLVANAESLEPKVLSDAMIYAVSPNGAYIATQGYSGAKVYNVLSGKVEYSSSEEEYYEAGIGRCISDNGIALLSPEYGTAEYWKDGELHMLDVPEFAKTSNLANAITADGSRICGSLSVADMTLEDGVLMQVPCIWNAEGDGYGLPVLLPHPDKDFTGGVPQYITAIDMSADGKIVVGQIMHSTGFFCYPIIYKEDENGEWSYTLPHIDLMNPDGIELPAYPGDGPVQPSYETYMTAEQIEAYNTAMSEYYDDRTLPKPKFQDYMSEEGLKEYTEAKDKYDEENEAWEEKYYAYFGALEEIMNTAPGYEFNSLRISPDGKSLANVVKVKGEDDPLAWFPQEDYNIWVFATDSEEIVKYDRSGDIYLGGVADNGVLFAWKQEGDLVEGYILDNGSVTPICDWMNTQVPAYATWINDNMKMTYWDYEIDEENEEYVEVEKEGLMTGRPASSADLSVVFLSVEDFEYYTDGDIYVFNVEEAKQASKVSEIAPADGKVEIFDLSGRKLNSATAPGIYIVNGKKKVVR